MPYRWTEPSEPDAPVHLTLWPYRSLSPEGFAAVILGFFGFMAIPLVGLLGTALLWGILPFMLAAIGALWWGLRASYRSGRLREDLTLDAQKMHLVRREARGAVKEWEANPYWVRANLYEDGGPVPHYITLSGNGREVEIGAFLSEEERKVLYRELDRHLRSVARTSR